MIRAIALDDDATALQLLTECCSRAEFLSLDKTFLDTDEAIKYLRKYPTDLMFLDVDMPKVSGLDLMKTIQETLQQIPMVIFITAHSEYAVRSYDVDAVDFLLKPFSFSRFMKAAQKADAQYKLLRGIENTSKPAIFLRSEARLIKILLQDIVFIESEKDYIKVQTLNDGMIISRMTMKAILELLPEQGFMRVHRSFVVPVGQVKEVRKKTLLVRDVEIPIGENYESIIAQHFQKT